MRRFTADPLKRNRNAGTPRDGARISLAPDDVVITPLGFCCIRPAGLECPRSERTLLRRQLRILRAGEGATLHKPGRLEAADRTASRQE